MKTRRAEIKLQGSRSRRAKGEREGGRGWAEVRCKRVLGRFRTPLARPAASARAWRIDGVLSADAFWQTLRVDAPTSVDPPS